MLSRGRVPRVIERRELARPAEVVERGRPAEVRVATTAGHTLQQPGRKPRDWSLTGGNLTGCSRCSSSSSSRSRRRQRRGRKLGGRRLEKRLVEDGPLRVVAVPRPVVLARDDRPILARRVLAQDIEGPAREVLVVGPRGRLVALARAVLALVLEQVRERRSGRFGVGRLVPALDPSLLGRDVGRQEPVDDRLEL